MIFSLIHEQLSIVLPFLVLVREPLYVASALHQLRRPESVEDAAAMRAERLD